MNEAAFNVALTLDRFGRATVARSVAIAPWSNLQVGHQMELEEQRQAAALDGPAWQAKVAPEPAMEAEARASQRAVVLKEGVRREAVPLAVHPSGAALTA
jgi:LAS superfamily LD-carboxypeptidase LdcB